MEKRRTFNAGEVLAAARAGTLSGHLLRKAIETAEQFGNRAAADELKQYLVSPWSFAGDDAPPEVRDRVAQGVSALVARGQTLSRTRQMFKKHGVIETLNRIARYPNATKNFDTLVGAGLIHLTAESIVVDYPEFFSTAALEVAKKRLSEQMIRDQLDQ